MQRCNTDRVFETYVYLDGCVHDLKAHICGFVFVGVGKQDTPPRRMRAFSGAAHVLEKSYRDKNGGMQHVLKNDNYAPDCGARGGIILG